MSNPLDVLDGNWDIETNTESEPNTSDALSCITDTGGCHEEARCVEIGNSFECVCNQGFDGDGIKFCLDVDECLKNNGGCSPKAKCVNTFGSKECACMAGYSGDGENCRWSTIQFGTAQQDLSQSLIVDSKGNIVLVGTTRGPLFDNANVGEADIFIASIKEVGDLDWTALSGSTENDCGVGIALGNNDNLFIAGYVHGSIDGQEHFGMSDIVVQKYSDTGSRSWTRIIGQEDNDSGLCITTDNKGNAYVGGSSNGDLGGFQSSGDDAVVIKILANGEIQWIQQLGGPNGQEWVNGVTVDGYGDVLVTGFTQAGLGGKLNQGGQDAFVAKYSETGQQKWVTLLGSSENDWSNSVSTDSSGNIYLAGHTNGDLGGNSGHGEDDAFVAKLSLDGKVEWIRLFGSSGYDDAVDIAVGPGGLVNVVGYVTGGLHGEASFGKSDAFLITLDAKQEVLETSLWGTEEMDGAEGVYVDSTNNVFITGLTFGMLAQTPYAGSHDSFLQVFWFD